jgi:hypothetical protein
MGIDLNNGKEKWSLGPQDLVGEKGETQLTELAASADGRHFFAGTFGPQTDFRPMIRYVSIQTGETAWVREFDMSAKGAYLFGLIPIPNTNQVGFHVIPSDESYQVYFRIDENGELGL